MKLTSRWVWGIAIGLLSVIGTGSLVFGQPIHGRWDIVSFDGVNVDSGGVASAMAKDGTLITLRGYGTFLASASGVGKPGAATGGGRWEISGSNAASGRYSVTGLILFECGPKPAPGTLPWVNDLVGDPDEARAGLLVLRVAYSDGSHGILVVSSRLEGTQDAVFDNNTATIFEGVTATKGFTDFWRNFPIGDSNRTLFHIRQQTAKDDGDDDCP